MNIPLGEETAAMTSVIVYEVEPSLYVLSVGTIVVGDTHDVRVIDIGEEDKLRQVGTGLYVQLSMDVLKMPLCLCRRMRVVLWITQWNQ